VLAVDSEDSLFILDTRNKAIRAVQKGKIYNLARNIESFGIAVEERDKLLVSDNITDTVIRFSGFYPPPPTPSPTG
jgi:predicted rRNA methylase YqxC with S4 and FtsJ domains